MDDDSNMMIEQTSKYKDVAAKTSSHILSTIRPYGYSTSKCGYCKGSRSNLIEEPESVSKLDSTISTPNPTQTSAPKPSLASKSYSVLADRLSPTLYEELINTGWRRSGLHLYKPQNFSSCCPTLTTRLLTREFQPSKSQRRVLKKVEKLFAPPEGPKQRNEESITVRMMTDAPTPNSTPTFTSKKQKRNHREQQIDDVMQQNSPPSGAGLDRMASSVPTSIQEEGAENRVLQILEEATTDAIDKFLSSSKGNFAKEKIKDFQWKTSYRILPPSKKDRKQSQIKAVSSVCAQIYGKLGSSLSDYPISREEFVKHLVDAIKNAQDSLIVTNRKIGNDTVNPVNDRAVWITSIDAHQPSGQIICTIRVNKEKTGFNKNETEKTADRNGPPSKEHNQRGNTEANECKLAQWYEKTTGKRLELDPNKHCITIETLPAHLSALNPEVHKLYAHYQHVVHGDPDPFSHEKNSSASSGENGEDDEDEGPKIETDNPSELDWGQAPTYFTDEISTMLTSYIQHLDTKECRRAVLSNYHSFFQFLVEAPFPLNDFCTKKNENHNNNGRYKQYTPGLECDVNVDTLSPKLPCGLYHQHYRIGGEFLIAVGVIDILPTGLSSVYLFYHPSFSYEVVALGKYAILKEIEFARDTLKVPHYYLGYYIESCQKMRYKADYKPTQILCPKYHSWVDASVAISKLRMTPRHVCPLAEPRTITCDEEKESDGTATRISGITASDCCTSTNDDITKELKLVQMDVGAGMNVTIDMLHPNGVEVVKPILKEFISEFTPTLSKKCVLKLN